MGTFGSPNLTTLAALTVLFFCQSLLGKRGWSDLLFMPNRGAEQAEHSAASNEKGESCLGGARQGRSDCGEEHTRPSPIFPEVD